jgi:uncharacterized protein YycO
MKTSPMTIRRFFLRVLAPLTRLIGKLHSPYSHKRITGDDCFAIEDMLKPGMAFITKTNGELSNIANPGFWKHGAIYYGDGTVIEAVGNGVVETNLITFLTRKDYVAVLQPTFADESEMRAAAEQALQWVGSPYDMMFELDDKAFYCYEVIYRAYKTVMDRLSKPMPFVIDNEFNVPTIIGDDFYKAKEKWQCLWDNSK